ncbi:MAG: hypothetical protein KJ734_10640, partial [Chloroflexi bacterium]|nr:hypothetical protein [Chloroflexota bacterium]
MKAVFVCLRYLMRGKVNALLHLKPAAAVSWGLFLVPTGWLAYAALALLQEHADLVPAYRYELTAALFAATFSMLGFAALVGMTSAQNLNYTRLQLLPLRAWQVYTLELLDKLVVLVPLLGLLAVPALRVTMLLGYDALAYARLAGVLALFVLLAVEALTLSLVLLQGGMGATRGAWRLIYTLAFLGSYVALVKARPTDALPLLQARWSPWAVAARAVLDGSLADVGLLAGLATALFPVSLASGGYREHRCPHQAVVDELQQGGIADLGDDPPVDLG